MWGSVPRPPGRKTPRRLATAATVGTAVPSAGEPAAAQHAGRRAVMKTDLPARPNARRSRLRPDATAAGGDRRPPRPRPEDGDRPRPPDRPGGPGENGPLPGGPGGIGRCRPASARLAAATRDFESLKTRDPELYKAMQEDRDLERQTRDQAEQYRRASKDEQAKIKEKLVEIVNKHFEVRQQLRNLEVKRLEQQLKQLRDKIDQREKNRKDIVEKAHYRTDRRTKASISNATTIVA